MRAIKVTINQEPAVLAGAGNVDSFTAIVMCKGKLGVATDVSEKYSCVDLSLSIFGMTTAAPDAPGEHVHWLPDTQRRLGDVIKFEMVDSPHPDAAIKNVDVEQDAAEASERERYIFENCKHTYFALRSKYETE